MAAQEFTPLFTKEQGASTNLGNLNFQQTFQGSQNYGVPNFQNQFSGLNYSPNLNLSNLGTNNPNLFSQYQMNNY